MTHENTQNKGDVWGAVKWVCIAFVAGLIAFGAYKAYKIATKPVEIVGDTAEKVTEAAEKATEAAKTGSVVIADKTDQLVNRLSIAVTAPLVLNANADSAFAVLTELEPVETVGIKENLFVRTELAGNEAKFCRLSMDFGAGEIPVYAAADNKAYQTAKSLGGVGDRLMRFVIRTPNDDVGINLESIASGPWDMRWRATTLKKPIGDEIAAARATAILEAVQKACR